MAGETTMEPEKLKVWIRPSDTRQSFEHLKRNIKRAVGISDGRERECRCRQATYVKIFPPLEIQR